MSPISTRESTVQFLLSELSDQDVIVRREAISQCDAVLSFVGETLGIEKILPRLAKSAGEDCEEVRQSIAVVLPKLTKLVSLHQQIHFLSVVKQLMLHTTDTLVRNAVSTALEKIVTTWLHDARKQCKDNTVLPTVQKYLEALCACIKECTESINVQTKIAAASAIPVALQIATSPVLESRHIQGVERHILEHIDLLVDLFGTISQDVLTMVRVASCEVFPAILASVTTYFKQDTSSSTSEAATKKLVDQADLLLHDSDENVFTAALRGCMIPFIELPKLCEDSSLVTLVHQVVHECQLGSCTKSSLTDAIGKVFQVRYATMQRIAPAEAAQLMEDYCHLLGPSVSSKVQHAATSVLSIACKHATRTQFRTRLLPVFTDLLMVHDSYVRLRAVEVCPEVLQARMEWFEERSVAGDVASFAEEKHEFEVQKGCVIQVFLNLLSDEVHEVRDRAVSVFVSEILPHVSSPSERVDMVQKLYKGVSSLEAPWRVVAAVLEVVPETCRLLGDAWWKNANGVLFLRFALFHQTVDAIRKKAIEHLPALQLQYGTAWIDAYVLPSIMDCSQSHFSTSRPSPYMVRIGCITAAKVLILNAKENTERHARLQQKLRDLFFRALEDKVPNVRRVAIISLAQILDVSSLDDLKGVTKLLSTRNFETDLDPDVQSTRREVLRLLAAKVDELLAS